MPPQDIIKTGSTGFRESFTMYSRPSAFGPPTLGTTKAFGAQLNWFGEDENRQDFVGGGVISNVKMDSRHGFNFPFTPPYYHGEGWCEMWMTASAVQMTIKEIQASTTNNTATTGVDANKGQQFASENN